MYTIILLIKSYIYIWLQHDTHEKCNNCSKNTVVLPHPVIHICIYIYACCIWPAYK